MNDDTRNFWHGAAWLVGLILLIALTVSCIVWADRYMDFEHVHAAHEHEHTHEEHGHPHPVSEHSHEFPEHEHDHWHSVFGGDIIEY